MLITFSYSLLLRMHLMYKITRYNSTEGIHVYVGYPVNYRNSPFRWWWTLAGSGMFVFCCMNQGTVTNRLCPETVNDFHHCLQPSDGLLFLFGGWRLALSTCWDPSLQIMCLHGLYINRYDTKSNTCTYMYASILHTVYTSYMYRPLTWPFQGGALQRIHRNITKLLNQCTYIKY